MTWLGLRGRRRGVATPRPRALRDPGGVLVVSCYELGHQPHGIALPAAFLERAGFTPAVLDLSRGPLDEAAVRRAEVVALSVPMHTALRVGIGAMRRIRALQPRAFICCYGLYAWLNAEYLLDGTADAVIGGEYEGALVALLEDLARGGRGEVPGVWTRGRRSEPVLERLDFPVPARGGLPHLASYARLVDGAREAVAGYTETTRGCLHHCLHCPVPPVYGGRFFAVPQAVVLADVERQVAAGARHI
ncbi:MAG TPA: CUAEP/CCAEP-tail radical SAM protein, partial [Gemmatimonadales bacterium]|nr:CUAEP/CCAEP-tail radical SAM protein [Gemmatimonadales bacterium]